MSDLWPSSKTDTLSTAGSKPSNKSLMTYSSMQYRQIKQNIRCQLLIRNYKGSHNSRVSESEDPLKIVWNKWIRGSKDPKMSLCRIFRIWLFKSAGFCQDFVRICQDFCQDFKLRIKQVEIQILTKSCSRLTGEFIVV